MYAWFTDPYVYAAWDPSDKNTNIRATAAYPHVTGGGPC